MGFAMEDAQKSQIGVPGRVLVRDKIWIDDRDAHVIAKLRPERSGIGELHKTQKRAANVASEFLSDNGVGLALDCPFKELNGAVGSSMGRRLSMDGGHRRGLSVSSRGGAAGPESV